LADRMATKVIGMALAFRPGLESPAALRFKELTAREFRLRESLRDAQPAHVAPTP